VQDLLFNELILIKTLVSVKIVRCEMVKMSQKKKMVIFDRLSYDEIKGIFRLCPHWSPFYFAYFVLLVPILGLIENTLSDLGMKYSSTPSKSPPIPPYFT